jgi:hypothetical protein
VKLVLNLRSAVTFPLFLRRRQVTRAFLAFSP